MSERAEPNVDELDLSRVTWRKSTASGSASECVEVAAVAGHVLLRDSKNPEGPKLVFTRQEFAAFLDGARRGEFDDLT